MKTPIELRNDKLGAKTVKGLINRHFEAWYFSEIPEALEKIFSLMPPSDVLSWGGSMTIQDLNIKAMAVEKGYKVIDRDKATTPEERHEMQRQALLCDTFLTSSNAISSDGQLVNIDGFGNRVAALTFGPKQVIVVAGINKVAHNFEDALRRARTIAAPMNVQRFPVHKTPCNELGTCIDCLVEDCVCAHFVHTRICKPAGRVKVILIGKELGF